MANKTINASFFSDITKKAIEAKKKEGVQKEYEFIIKEIMKVAKNGEYSIRISNISEAVKNKLIKDQFIVKSLTNKFGLNKAYDISWQIKKEEKMEDIQDIEIQALETLYEEEMKNQNNQEIHINQAIISEEEQVLDDFEIQLADSIVEGFADVEDITNSQSDVLNKESENTFEENQKQGNKKENDDDDEEDIPSTSSVTTSNNNDSNNDNDDDDEEEEPF